MNKKYAAKTLIICINILLLSLGIWQIKRGQYKQQMLDLQAKITQDNSSNISLSELEKSNINIQDSIYKHIIIKGKFIDSSFYLYRVYNGKSGYWLINPLIIENTNNIVLVAHKFISSPKQNVFLSVEDLNKLNTTDYNSNIEISTYVLPQLPRVFNLTSDNFNTKTKNLMVQNINSNEYAKHYIKNNEYKILGITLISLSEELPDLKQHAMTPDKHYGYAATWLGLCLVSLCFSYGLFRKREIKY